MSFVLNDTPGQSIPPATRTAVHRAAQELGYAPSAAARILRSGSSKLVLCLEPDWEPSALMDRAIATLSHEVEQQGYTMVVSRSGSEGSAPALLAASISPAAVVAMYDLPATVRDVIIRLQVPVEEAWFHSSSTQEIADNVQTRAGSAQTEHLLARGAGRLIAVEPQHLRESEVRDDRLAGIRAAARRLGVSEPDIVYLPSLERRTLGVLKDALSTGSERIGVCAFNDLHAAATLLAARQLRLRVPDDVLVIGVDDDPLALLTTPELSSVRFGVEEHMRSIANRVIARVEGRTTSLHSYAAPVQVIQRETT